MINRVMVVDDIHRKVFECQNLNDAHWLYENLVRQGMKNVFLLDPSGRQYKLGYHVESMPIPISEDTILTGPAAERLKSEIATAALKEKNSASTPPRNASRKPRPAQVQD